jgi:hypothetical protein
MATWQYDVQLIPRSTVGHPFVSVDMVLVEEMEGNRWWG